MVITTGFVHGVVVELLTEIALVAVLAPSIVVTVIVTEPVPTPVTTPALLTVAIVVFPELQLTPLFVALLGATVAVKVTVEPILTVAVAGAMVTPVTGDEQQVTAIDATAVFAPSTVVTVIEVVPVATPVATPWLFTLAITELLDAQVTFLLVAFDGLTVAVKLVVEPTFILSVTGEITTPVTGTDTGLTVIILVAVLVPSAVVTVIVALPDPTPVTIPSEFIVAMPELLVDQLTDLLVALLGNTVAVSVVVEPAFTLAVVGVTLTPVTGTSVPPPVPFTSRCAHDT